MIARTVLLDTNALLWLAVAPEKLSGEARDILASPSTELVVSAASAWEVAIKTHAGKLPGGQSLLSVWDETMASIRAETIPIEAADAIMAGALPWPHRDAFDRMLITQAARRALTLASSDPAVLAGALSPTIDTRAN
ncbi:type II toxin-antitoxin system VapC family toxin [Smaragdicoccus niigatensis]|uniref:type II toxin-antitoxin system VapC family toxin n=1 Tax=Smaragdicoccus niigatensis TaxID=359359 RepID=UPI00036C1934|nr:type II toxin-antitoxin system VapC family toxin [Smaragdicoccus niigatensis]